MRAEDQTKILDALEQRVTATRSGRAAPMSEVLEDSLYFERRRLKEDRGKSPAFKKDTAFWDRVANELRGASDAQQRRLTERAVRHYGEEIAGNFDDRVYQVVTRAMPPALGLLLNAVSPIKLAKRLPDLPSIDDAIVVQGEVEQLRKLHEKGTVVLVPTHVSNLDSIVAGYALYRMGLPPFLYGAGLNLFTNPLLSFFMHNLGAYTVDRKKQDPLYKDALKAYAQLTLEHGYDNIFFPGGTRSRSGAIEKRLKLGLAGCGLQAYIENLKANKSRPDIFVVPCTLSFELVLEAETLIDDFLKEVGKARYIIDDDEFTKPSRLYEFMTQLVNLDSKIHVTISRAVDAFGNDVDDEGVSLDPCGRSVDTSRYVLTRDGPASVADRDQEYTREVGERIVEAFLRDNVVECTHVTAYAIFSLLRERNPRMNVLRVIRTGGEDEDLALADVYRRAQALSDKLFTMSEERRIRVGPSVKRNAEDTVSDGLKHFSIYHTRPAAKRRGDRVVPSDRTLLLYYQNRLEGYGLDALGGAASLSPDHRALAAR